LGGALADDGNRHIFERMVVVRDEHGRAEEIVSFYVDLVDRQYGDALAEVAAVVNQNNRFMVVGGDHDVHARIPVDQDVVSYFYVASHGATDVARRVNRQEAAYRCKWIRPGQPQTMKFSDRTFKLPDRIFKGSAAAFVHRFFHRRYGNGEASTAQIRVSS
jgi:hypothetical protein